MTELTYRTRIDGERERMLSVRDIAESDIEVFRVNSVDGIVYVFDDATNAESYLNRWCKGTTNT